MRRIVSLLAICAALVSCGNTGGKSTGDEFQSINWRDNDAAAVICVGMYTNESDLRDSRLLDRYSKSYGLENLETVQTKGDEWYIVIPRHSKATVKVNAVEIDENCNLHKSMLLAERDGRPFLLRCNVSDLYCNVAISIEDKDGNVLYVAEPKNEQAISEESAFLMQQMLLAGMTEPGGTSQALWSYDIHHFDTNFGGKTGTTSNNSDGWYVGVTKNLVAGCWCGGEYRSVHFRSGRMGQGSHTALPAFGYFMEKVLRDPQLAAKYRGKISDKPWPGLRVDDRPYNCQGYVAPSDTTDVDSTDVEDIDMTEEEIELDNNGNEIPSEPAQGNI